MLHLTFSPIYDYQTFLKTINKNARGVYVWGFKNPVGLAGPFEYFLPYYVGQADKTTILQRIQGHYNLVKDYHIFLSKYLHEYYKYLQTDAAIKSLTSTEYNIYKSYFAYLNTGNNGEAINKKKVTSSSIQSHIAFYQQYFHVCYITVTDKNTTSVSELEKHINFHIPHILIGKTNAKHSNLFHIDCRCLADDSFYYNFNVKGF